MNIESDNGYSLIVDPWILGSCYWRSWWNFPEPKKSLINSLKPDCIYLTHIHWDHFHSVSLEKFSKDVKFVIPAGNFSRMKRDLFRLGYKNVTEIKHGCSINLDNDLKITSYVFSPFFDSSLVVENNGTTLLNLNDSKFFGLPLRQILRNHPSITFVFRSHSNANSQLSYKIFGSDSKIIDHDEKHLSLFYKTVVKTKAKYVVPFASNHCLLHKDNFHLNDHINTPLECLEYFEERNQSDQKLKVMISGDSWSSEKGFKIGDHSALMDRQKYLLEYQSRKRNILNNFYLKESKAKIRFSVVERYFNKFLMKLPLLLKLYFKGTKILYVLTKDSKISKIIMLDVYKNSVKELNVNANIKDNKKYPMQIHTTEFIFQRCIAFGIFSHLTISKRLKILVTQDHLRKLKLFNLIINMVEYELLPIKFNFRSKSIANWVSRWRELVLYMFLIRDFLFTGSISAEKYLADEN